MPQLRVFYLDDEPDLCTIFSDEFLSTDIEITTFTDPQKAIEEAKQNPPDLLFIDYRLPSTTGDQVAIKMPANMPKYLITGDITIKTTYKFQGVFTKPFDTQAIRAVMTAMLPRKIAA